MPALALALPYLTQKPIGGGSGGDVPANAVTDTGAVVTDGGATVTSS